MVAYRDDRRLEPLVEVGRLGKLGRLMSNN